MELRRIDKENDMTFVSRIITRHRTQLEGAGLLHRTGASQISPNVARMRTSPRKAIAALRERPLLRITASPFHVLFEQTLPKIEHILVELGEERAEHIVGRLCEHGQKMLIEHEIEKARKHLEELYKDLPDYEARFREEPGIDEIIEAYRLFHFEGMDADYIILKHGAVGYLQEKLGDKISQVTEDPDGMIVLIMAAGKTEDSDLECLHRVKNLKTLGLIMTTVTDAGLVHLRGLRNLRRLFLAHSRITNAGLAHLKDLQKLRELTLFHTAITNDGLPHLQRLANLQSLNLSNTKVDDEGLPHLVGIQRLQSLDLGFTTVTDSGILALVELPALQELQVENTPVTEIGAQQFKSSSPTTNWVHRNPWGGDQIQFDD